jgi:hypothetical protein
MDQAARVFLQPDFGDPYPFSPVMEQDIQAAVFPKLNRQAGEGNGGLPAGTAGHEGGIEVPFIRNFLNNGTTQTPGKKVCLPGSQGIEGGKGPVFFPADGAGRFFTFRAAYDLASAKGFNPR